MSFLDALVQKITVVADTQAYDIVDKKNKQVIRSSTELGKAMKRAFSGVAAYFSIRSITRYADEWKNIDSTLRLVTGSEKERLGLQERLFDISQRTRQNMENTVDLYRRIFVATEKLGTTESDRLRTSEAINKALIIGGGTTQGNRAALIQLGQGLSANALRGQELNSIMEQSPRLAQAIADGLGLQVGDLRGYAERNRGIRSNQVMDALLSQVDQLNKEFKSVNLTIAQSGVLLTNSFGRLVNNIDRATGFSSKISSFFVTISKFMDNNVDRITSIFMLVKRIVSLFILVKAMRLLREFEIFDLFFLNLKNGLPLVKAFMTAISTSDITAFLKTTKALLIPWAKLLAIALAFKEVWDTISGKDTYLNDAINSLPQREFEAIKSVAGEGAWGRTLQVLATPGVALETGASKLLERVLGERRQAQNVNVTQYISSSDPRAAGAISAENINKVVAARGGDGWEKLL